MKIPILLCSLFAASAASASLIVYEGFDYPIAANSLVGTGATATNAAVVTGVNGGTGFSGAWNNANQVNATQTIANPDVVAGLGYTDSLGNTLVTSGGAMFLDSTNPSVIAAAGTFAAIPWRDVSGAFDSVTTGGSPTVFISLLGVQSATQARAFNFAFFAASGTAERFSLGHGTNTPSAAGPFTWDVFTAGGGNNGNVNNSNNNHSTVLASTLSLSVLRVDLNFNGAAERFTLYVNPTDLNTEPGTPSVTFERDMIANFNEIDKIRPFAGNSNGTLAAAQGTFDELRIGTTWTDVTPNIPEPSAVLLAGIGLLGMIRRRRA